MQQIEVRLEANFSGVEDHPGKDIWLQQLQGVVGELQVQERQGAGQDHQAAKLWQGERRGLARDPPALARLRQCAHPGEVDALELGEAGQLQLVDEVSCTVLAEEVPGPDWEVAPEGWVRPHLGSDIKNPKKIYKKTDEYYCVILKTRMMEY